MAGDDGEGVLGFSPRRALVAGLVAAVLAFGAVALIGQAADYDEVLEALRGADPVLLALAGVGQVIAFAGYVLGFHGIARARGGPALGYWTVVRVRGIGLAAYILGSAAGGLATDFWALHRAGADVHDASRRVLGLNTVQWAVLGVFAASAGAAVLLGAGEAPTGMALGWLVVLPVSVALGAWISTPARARRLAAIPGDPPPERGRDPRRWARWAWSKVRTGLADVIGGVVFVRWLVSHPGRAPEATAGWAVYWLGDLVTLGLALRAFDVEPKPFALVLAYATGYVIAAAPLPAGAAGAAEATLAFSLTAIGVELDRALLAVFVYRFYTFWLPIPIALLFLTRVRSVHRELPGKGRAVSGGGEPETDGQ